MSNVSNKKMIEFLHGFPFIAVTIQMSMCSLLILLYWTFSPSSNPYKQTSTILTDNSSLKNYNNATDYTNNPLQSSSLSSLSPSSSASHSNIITTVSQSIVSKIQFYFNEIGSPIWIASVFYGFSQLSTLFALNYGSLSFTQLTKATEPFFHAVFGKFMYNANIQTLSYVSLLPILIGMSLLVRSTTRAFPWLSFLFGILSNLFAVFREIYIKKYDLLLTPPPTSNSTATSTTIISTTTTTASTSSVVNNKNANNIKTKYNVASNNNITSNTLTTRYKTLPPLEQSTLYSVFMLHSLPVLLPFAILFESARFFKLISTAMATTGTSTAAYTTPMIIKGLFTMASTSHILIGISIACLSGILFYLNTQLAMSVLREASPVTRAFANGMKRIVILTVSLLFFRRMTDDSWDWTDITSIFATLAEGDIDLDFDFLDLD